MYQDFYGLSELPFELTPNPKYLFLTPQHQEALSTLQYGLASAKAITVLTGEAGTGKTTLLRAASQSERCQNVVCLHINNPTLTRSEFIETLSQRFDLGPHASVSKAAFLEALDRILREQRARGQITALVLDEAQSLSVELLEEVRLLANIETATEKLLPLVLSGQPELRDRLNVMDLRQLKQRITLRCEIAPFTLQQTAAYIAARIRIAGGAASKLFTREAVVMIHERSRGIPRTVSVLCDNALVTGFGLGRRPIDQRVVGEVVRDFDLDADAPTNASAVGLRPNAEAPAPPVSEHARIACARGAHDSDDSNQEPNDQVGPDRPASETFGVGAGLRRLALFRGRLGASRGAR